MTRTAGPMGRTVVVATAAAVVVFPGVVFLLGGGSAGDPWSAVVMGLGYTALTLLCAQLILSARVPLLDRLYGADRLIKAHRLNGKVLLGVIALHAAAGLFKLDESGRSLVVGLSPFGIVFTGAAAGTIVAIAAFAGLRQDKLNIPYEEWRNLHRLAYYVLPIVLLHALVSGWARTDNALLFAHSLVLAVLAGAALLDRGRRFLAAMKRPSLVTGIMRRAPDVTSIRFERPIGFRLRPGQFCELAMHREPSHPFTISSGSGDDELEVTAKSIGDFTDSWPTMKVGTHIIVTGPHGRLIPECVIGAPRVVLLAGGIGITPFMSMLRSAEFWDHPELESVTLLWSIRAASTPPFLDEIVAIGQERPLTTHMVLTSTKGSAGDVETGTSAEFTLRDVGLQPFARGRVTREVFVRAGICSAPELTSYALCGPDGFMAACRAMLRQAGVRRSRIVAESFRL